MPAKGEHASRGATGRSVAAGARPERRGPARGRDEGLPRAWRHDRRARGPDARGAGGRGARRGGPVGLRQVHAARARRRASPSPTPARCEVSGERAPEARRSACSYMPQRDLLLPWRDALANAALALESEGVPRREARRRAEPLFERFGLARVRADPARGAVGGHAPAGGLPAHAAARAPGARARRAVRGPRRDHPSRHAAVAGGCAAGGAAHGGAGDPRRGGGRIPVGSGGRALVAVPAAW